MINLNICKNKQDVQIFFAGIRHGIREMENFHERKNVNTGKKLTIEEMLSDFKIFEENAMFLFEKGSKL